MPDPMKLDVHDIVVTQEPVFSPTGTIQQLTVVRYWVGTHGPFVSSAYK